MRRLRVSYRGRGWLLPWLVEEPADPDGVRCVFWTWDEAQGFADELVANGRRYAALADVPWRSPEAALSGRITDTLVAVPS